MMDILITFGPEALCHKARQSALSAVGIFMQALPTTGRSANDRKHATKYQLSTPQIRFLSAGSPKLPMAIRVS